MVEVLQWATFPSFPGSHEYHGTRDWRMSESHVDHVVADQLYRSRMHGLQRLLAWSHYTTVVPALPQYHIIFPKFMP